MTMTAHERAIGYAATTKAASTIDRRAYIEVPVVVVVLEVFLRLVPSVELPLKPVIVRVPLSSSLVVVMVGGGGARTNSEEGGECGVITRQMTHTSPDEEGTERAAILAVAVAVVAFESTPFPTSIEHPHTLHCYADLGYGNLLPR